MDEWIEHLIENGFEDHSDAELVIKMLEKVENSKKENNIISELISLL